MLVLLLLLLQLLLLVETGNGASREGDVAG